MFYHTFTLLCRHHCCRCCRFYASLQSPRFASFIISCKRLWTAISATSMPTAAEFSKDLIVLRKRCETELAAANERLRLRGRGGILATSLPLHRNFKLMKRNSLYISWKLLLTIPKCKGGTCDNDALRMKPGTHLDWKAEFAKGLAQGSTHSPITQKLRAFLLPWLRNCRDIC